MSLVEYRQKRRFTKTPEPAGKKPPRRKSKALRFVIQKHAARRLHYDLRLEWEGTLKSWAVPKGPSLDPKEKRLAVEVEDHPLEYAKFEGHIPEGEYGAGEVIIWDRGTWTPKGDAAKGLKNGKLEFELDGEKLSGRWVLVRTRSRQSGDKPSWLLIKRTDDAARPLSEFDVAAERRQSVKSGRLLGVDQEEAGALRVPLKVAGTLRVPSKSNNRRRSAAKPTAAQRQKPDGPRSVEGDGTRSVPTTWSATATIAGAKKAPMPQSIAVQLATLAAEAPSGDQWIHEVKFDGYRMICRIDRGKVQLITRNQQDWTHRYNVVADAARRLPLESAILDGEVVALLSSGVTSFQALQNAGKAGSTAPLAYYAFDLLYLDGYDLRRAALVERKRLLEQLLAAAGEPHVLLSEHFETSGPAFRRQCCQMGLEGVISKRRDRPYVGGRTEDWIKSKCLGREELVIGGFTLSTAVKRGIGALLVGYFDDGQLVYAGRVGTGFSEQVLVDLRQRLEKLKRDESPFAAVPARERGREVRWVRPELVADVEFTAWTDDGILRHPSFQGLREDKSPREIGRPASLQMKAIPAPRSGQKGRRPSAEDGDGTRSKPATSEAAMNGKSRKSSTKAQRKTKTKPKGTPTTTRGLPVPDVNVRLTSPDRVLYADMGLTKLGLASYYAQIADWILPHLVDRPLSLVRCPEGQKSGKCFYQKHIRPGTPAALGRVTIEENDGPAEYVYVKDLEGLLSLVQMNVLEIHPWGSKRDNVDRPDRLIIDLDPDPAVPWQRVIEAALAVRRRLEEFQLESFLKTTGGKGLHVVIPLSPRRHDWPAAKAFCKRLADEFAAGQPDLYIAKMSKSARKGKIFIDYLRNDHGSTAIAAYSTRAKPGAPVSVPVGWEELSEAIRSDHFNVSNLPARLATLRRDPWDGIERVKQGLPSP